MGTNHQVGGTFVAGDAGQAHEPQEGQPGYVHPDAKALFKAVPLARAIPLFGTTTDPFGPKCVVSLGVVALINTGVAKQLLNSSMYAMYMKKYGVDVAEYQRMTGISSMGFAIKPVPGILSDAFAFFGYTKRWYMALSCIVGAVAAVVYGILPFKPSSSGIAAGMIFISVFCIANINVLSEGQYSRLIKADPIPGADLVSWIWMFIMIGQIIAAGIQGPLSDSGRPTVGIFISAALQAVRIVFFVFNWYGEKTNRVARQEDYLAMLKTAALQSPHSTSDSEPTKTDAEMYANAPDSPQKLAPASANSAGPRQQQDTNTELVQFEELEADDETVEASAAASSSLNTPSCLCGVFEVNKEMLTRNAAVVLYGALMTAGVIALTVLTILGTTYELLYGCIGISVILSVTGFLCVPVMIMKANFYGWCQLVSYILISGGTDNFYMADAECLPNGPHFTQTFYTTVAAVIGNVAGLVGVYMFARVFDKQSYRVTLICTTLVQVFASVFDIIMVERWNLSIGIPDHAMYIMGDAVVYQVCYMLNYMPLNILISRLCPKGCESTMFAILASFSNLGASTSSTIGAILMETAWPLSAEPPCDFSNLRWLIIVGHLTVPLIAIPLVFLLIPGTRICDDIDPKHVEAVSILQKWINSLTGSTTPQNSHDEVVSMQSD